MAKQQLNKKRCKKSTNQEDERTIWSSTLLTEIMLFILDKLWEPIDHARFARVCKEWHSLAKLYNREHRPCNILPRPPMLYVVPKVRPAHLYSISETRIYNDVKLPELDDENRVYCGHGWFGEVKYYKTETNNWPKSGVSITLVNHLGKSRETISLPLLNNLPTFPENCFGCNLPADPNLDRENYVVIAQHNYRVFFLKSGQECWKRLPILVTSLSGVKYYQGRVHAIMDFGDRFMSYHSYDVNSHTSYVNSHTQYKISKPQDVIDKVCATYLVESTKGDLLVVKRLCLRLRTRTRTRGFKVYKLTLVGSTAELVEVNNIGDEALFVGENQSLSVLASKLSGCQPNCIYYTKDTLLGRSVKKNINKAELYNDVGVFNLQDGSITQHYPQSKLKGLKSPAVWITTSFSVE